MTSRTTGSRAFPIAVAIFVLTVGQLAVATFVPGLSQFEGKGFGARLVLYPAMMLLVPAIWLVRERRSGRTGDGAPWAAFAWIMLPFLIDVTGNTFNLYDAISWWDDLNHLVNWCFLSLGTGLLLRRAELGPRWVLAVLIAGLGALMAIGWEVGEYYAFIRHSSELQTAYTDTLGDEVLGTLGATVAALIITLRTPATVQPCMITSKKTCRDHARLHACAGSEGRNDQGGGDGGHTVAPAGQAQAVGSGG